MRLWPQRREAPRQKILGSRNQARRLPADGAREGAGALVQGGYDWADSFPTIVEAASRLKASSSLLIDGEPWSAGRMGCRISMRCAAGAATRLTWSPLRDAAVIFPPGILLRVAEDIRPRDVMMDADLSASEPGEVFLSHVSASAIEAVCLLMIDSLDLETLMAVVPRRRFVGVDDRALDDLGADEWGGLTFRVEYCGDRIATSLPDHDNNLAIAALVPWETTVTAIFFLVGGRHIAAEVVDLGFLDFTADKATFDRSKFALEFGDTSARMVPISSTRWLHSLDSDPFSDREHCRLVRGQPAPMAAALSNAEARLRRARIPLILNRQQSVRCIRCLRDIRRV
jgi:hypothetical protein